MDQNQITDDLKFIRQTMEASVRYTNLPPQAYLGAGILGLAGTLITWFHLGPIKISDPARFTSADVTVLALLWAGVLLLAAAQSAIFIALRARRLGIPALAPPGRRMFWSQTPVLAAAGLLTLGLFAERAFGLLPGLWLMSYGLALFAFHYYTGRDHLIQSFLFLGLGAAAVFAPGWLSLVLLGLGFGAVNLVFGVMGLLRGGAPR